ncbi:GNAT family protein [Paenibacillus sp. HB172176]|uniref:GNAT family N-acetyltransferase n=1 Tax=Paenibacillus sp. HB172176 TaxID=2493690 RepID=UPI0014395832|nr:GNAT family protein [Paenibacillus sp. HB172176]
MKTIEEHFDPFPVLETDRTLLRQIRHEDAEDMFRYCKVPEVSRYTSWYPHQTSEDSRVFIELILNKYAIDKIGPWGIQHKETNKLIGSCSFINWDNKLAKAELAYAMSNEFWNQGLMSEIARRLIRFAFDELHLIRVEARCHPDNIGSFRVMEKAGMQLEGRIRKALCVKGEFIDVLQYSIINENE